MKKKIAIVAAFAAAIVMTWGISRINTFASTEPTAKIEAVTTKKWGFSSGRGSTIAVEITNTTIQNYDSPIEVTEKKEVIVGELELFINSKAALGTHAIKNIPSHMTIEIPSEDSLEGTGISNAKIIGSTISYTPGKQPTDSNHYCSNNMKVASFTKENANWNWTYKVKIVNEIDEWASTVKPTPNFTTSTLTGNKFTIASGAYVKSANITGKDMDFTFTVTCPWGFYPVNVAEDGYAELQEDGKTYKAKLLQGITKIRISNEKSYRDYEIEASTPWQIDFKYEQKLRNYSVRSLVCGGQSVNFEAYDTVYNKVNEGVEVKILVAPTKEEDAGKIIDKITITNKGTNAIITPNVKGNTVTFTMPANPVEITEITFKEDDRRQFNLTGTANEMVTASGTQALGTVKFYNSDQEEISGAHEGDEVTVKAVPTDKIIHYDFKLKEWSCNKDTILTDDNRTQESFTFTMPAEGVNFSAEFEKTGTSMKLKANNYTGGDLYATFNLKTEGKEKEDLVKKGAQIEITIENANVGWRCVGWTILENGTDITSDTAKVTFNTKKRVQTESGWLENYSYEAPTITIGDDPIEVTAKFEARAYQEVTVSSSDPKMGTATVGTANATTSQEFVGDTVTITATPASDLYALREWKVISPVQNDSTVDADKITIIKTGENTATFTMINQPVEIQAVFYKAKKSSEKELKEVYLLDADDKEKVIGVAARSGTDWTITLPDTLTKDEADAYLSGQGAYLKLVASEDALIGQKGAYQETGAADEAKWANGEVYCFNMTLNKPTTFTVTAENGSTQDYTITIVYTGKKPKLTVESSERTSDTEAKASFKTDTAGTYYYLYKKAAEKAPTVEELKNSALNGSVGVGNVQSLNLKSLDGSTAYKIYVLVKTDEDKLSDMLVIDIPSLGAYTIKKNPQSGGTVTVDKSRANAGETITVTVKPNTGKRVDFLSYSTEVAGSAPVEITNKVDATTYTFEMPAANISIGCTWADVKDAAIIGFVVNGVNGVINESAGTISIVLPYGTDLTSLKPVITLSGATSVSPASGETVNLSGPVTYTVTGEDGTTKTYKVTAVTSEQPKSDKLWESMLEQTGGSTDHTGKNTWWKKAKDMKKHNDYPKYW